MRRSMVLGGLLVLAGCVDYGPGYGYQPGYGYAQPAYYPPAQPAYAPYGYYPGQRTIWTGPNEGMTLGPPPPQGTRARERWQANQGTEVSQGN